MASLDQKQEKTIEDLLHLLESKMNLQSERIGQLQEELEAERKEFHAARELLHDLISEYDRLTDRVSTQLAAMIRLHEEQKKAS